MADRQTPACHEDTVLPQRLQQLKTWLQATLSTSGIEVVPVSGDASFRRYFRVVHDGRRYIVMDAPPAHEDCRPFVRVARLFAELGLNVPVVHAQDLEQGFLLSSDLGDRLYLGALNAENVERLYGDALDALATLQACGRGHAEALPPYDRALLVEEMGRFHEWYLGRHLGMRLDAGEEAVLTHTFAALADSALAQPRVCVHRDYHSRNLMVHAHNPGILDFQDAMYGPITYDLVSLLRDCYIAWPDERVYAWVRAYYTRALQAGVPLDANEAQFIGWFDLMGVQRHLKAIGIFARLMHRDGKAAYLKDIPRTLGYVRAVAARYPVLADFHALLQRRVDPVRV